MAGWIGVDLDGTLAKYDGWYGIGHIGEPIVPMVERVKDWLARGIEVRIFTARVSLPPGKDLDEAIDAIGSWCQEHIGQTLAVTCEKDFGTIEIWDDRAIQVKFNTGERVR